MLSLENFEKAVQQSVLAYQRFHEAIVTQEHRFKNWFWASEARFFLTEMKNETPYFERALDPFVKAYGISLSSKNTGREGSLDPQILHNINSDKEALYLCRALGASLLSRLKDLQNAIFPLRNSMSANDPKALPLVLLAQMLETNSNWVKFGNMLVSLRTWGQRAGEVLEKSPDVSFEKALTNLLTDLHTTD